MVAVGEYLDSMVILAASPDRNIRARVANYTEVEVAFQPGTFERYDEGQLSHQLARLGALTWIAYHRGRSEAYRKALRLSAEELAAAERPTDDPHCRRYEEELGDIEAEGVSTGRALRVRTTGMIQWKVQIQPGAIRRFGERSFVAEIHSAVKAWRVDRAVKIAILKSEYFDLGIPARWRELMNQLRGVDRRAR